MIVNIQYIIKLWILHNIDTTKLMHNLYDDDDDDDNVDKTATVMMIIIITMMIRKSS